MHALQVFALGATRAFAELVAATLHVALSAHEERSFEDGEFKCRPLDSVRGNDVYVLHSLYGDTTQSASDKLMRLLVFIGAVRDAGAARVTAVVPYLCFARKDRRTKSRDPLTSRYVAQLIEAMGCDGVLSFDVHNLAAYENAFRIVADHLEAAPLFADVVATLSGSSPLTVVSPDAGGVKRAERFRRALAARVGREVGAVFMEKHRSAGVVSGTALVGDVRDRTAVIVDDLIASGTTLTRAAAACRAQGAVRVYAIATHGLFAAGADTAIASMPVDHLIITDTVPPFRLGPETCSRLQIVSVAPRLADAIAALHAGTSLHPAGDMPDD